MSHTDQFFTHPNVGGGQSPASIESDLKVKPEPPSVGDLPYETQVRKADTEHNGSGFEAMVRQETVKVQQKTAGKLDSQSDQLPGDSGRAKG